MKLLVNATSIASSIITGIERFALRMSQELYRIDQSVEVFSGNPIPSIPEVRIPFLLTIGNRLLKRREYLLRAIWDQTFFRQNVKKNKIDVVFFPIADGMVDPPCRQIVTVHDLHYFHFEQALTECNKEIGRLRTTLYHHKFPRILNDSSAIVTVSESTKEDLVQVFDIAEEKIHVVYNGYDEERFQEIAEPESVLGRYGLRSKQYFISVGSILRHKNLVRVVSALRQLHCDATLVLVGACKDAGYLQEIREAAGMCKIAPDRLRYLDYVPDGDLPSLYSGAIAFLMPSLHEGFGVPIIEAMACGTPVITSNCSAMPEVAGGAALMVNPYSIESIAASMKEVLENPGFADTMRAKGFERARKFKWSSSAQKLYELCRMVSSV